MLCYYISLAYFDHKILKCAGGCPDEAHRRFYEPHFAVHGDFCQRVEDGPFVVVLCEYQGDKVRLPDFNKSKRGDATWQSHASLPLVKMG